MTFMSEVLYNGFLTIKRYRGSLKEALIRSFKRLPESASLKITGKKNEGPFFEKIIKSLNPSFKGKINLNKYENNVFSPEFLNDILSSELIDNVRVDPSKFLIKLKGNKMLLGDESVTALQLFKVDRYSGITSLETKYTVRQVTFFMSLESALTALVGLYSSYVTSIRYGGGNINYYFLFFSPEEVLSLTLPNGEKYLESYFLVKEGVIRKLREVISDFSSSELLLLETLISTELQRLMVRENLDKVSFMLFRIALEGRTYKIYEQLPITIYREPVFYKTVQRYFRDPQRFCERLSTFLGPKDVILSALSSLSRANRYSESDNVLRAIQELYRFVVLGVAEGWMGFLKEIYECYLKLINSDDPKEKGRALRYLSIVRSFRM